MTALLRQAGLLLGVLAVSLFVFAVSISEAQTKIVAQFENVVAVETACGLSSAWPDSSAKANIKQGDGSTKITVKVKDTVPDVFWTVWIRLAGESPLAVTGMSQMGSTPMAPIAAINDLAAATPDGNLSDDAFAVNTGDNGAGSDNVINGFFTDANGAGRLKLELDFPLIKGAVPFHEVNDDFSPVAIGTDPVVPFTLRIVSHCIDNVGHGLVPGGQLDPETEQPLSTNHEIWFEWDF
ncbi:MAG TPA: hypothetical protein EYN18_01415 [Nitrospirales bacterium]|nr:hypothetical protein [Nitrospirales bacterium]HIN33478.1 hypothetical protein [Nitrospirales bacterium]HIO21042.1 hypothetical protein [Nitrospirales bacterium]